MNEETSEKMGATIFSFLAGAAIGAGLGLLLAPKSGQETREQIKGLANDAMDKTKGYVDKGKECARTIQGKAQDMMGRGKEKGEEMMGEARQRMQEMGEEKQHHS